MRLFPIALFLLPASTALAVPPTGARPDADTWPWWNDTVFYEVFVRSFQDSDGDGVGDLRGLIDRLDDLTDGDPATTDDLGVTGLWLMPITQSPSYHGYDVTDYRRVDEEYGTNDDFRELMDEAHARGIRVIVDLVMNHSSSQHPWFRDSARRENGRADWYVWRADHPGWKGPWGSEAWHRADGATRPDPWYYGVFWGGMPDLNYANADVTAEMFDVVRFWLEEMNVDGFRLDAIKHLIENGPVQENTPATHAWFRDYYRHYKSIRPDAITVGEVWSGTDEVLPYIGDEVDLAFEFRLAGAMLQSARREDSAPVREALRDVCARYPPQQWATFLTNHDQDRTMTALAGSVNHARTAASLLLTSPGVPFLYYGEEIGQQGGKPDENIRSPMQWSGGPRAGFTTGTPWRAPQADADLVNVEAQRMRVGSLWSHYRDLIDLRNRHAALRRGAWGGVPASDDRLYACLRWTADDAVLVLINLGDEALSGYRLSPATSELRPSLVGVDLPSLSPYETVVIPLPSPEE